MVMTKQNLIKIPGYLLIVALSFFITDNFALAKILSSEDVLTVDCLLPGKMRQLGATRTYLTKKRPIKTSANDCEIRGGEYVRYDRANYATALKVWLPEAKGGDAEAQTFVGEIFEKGLGTDSDFPAAVAWYKKAAAQGFSRAMLNLGYLYEKGFGVEKDTREALNWYRRASGLDDDSLEYASSIQVSLASKDKQIAQLSQESESNQKEIARLRVQLEQKETELKRIKQEQDAARAKLTEVQNQLQDPRLATLEVVEEERARLSSSNAQLQEKLAALTQSKTALDQLASTLSAGQQEAAHKNVELGIELAKKDVEVERLQRRLVQVDSDLEESRTLLENDATKDIALVARLNAVEEERHTLGQQLNTSQQKALSLSTKLNEAKGQLDENSEQYTRRQNDFEQQKALYDLDKRRLEKERNQLAEKAGYLEQKSDADVAKIQALRQQLEQQKSRYDSELGKLSTQYETTKNDLEESDLELSALKQEQESMQQVVVVESPTIELIEPPVTLTRGEYVVGLQGGITERTIIGRVTAPAGLLSFNINDLPIAVDDTGLFQTTIPVPEQHRKVAMAAADAQGQRVTFEFNITKPAQAKQTVDIEQDNREKERFRIKNLGKYYALVIGNNNYSGFVALKTPVADATEVSRILQGRYGYKSTLLLNANRYDILSALSELRKKLTKNDNLLVYYAGHGTINETTGQGYWLPIDAESDSIANWIATNSITDILNTMTTKHVLVVADSCYSGVLTRTALARLQSGKTFEQWERWYNKMASLRARLVMTSGGLEPVNDGGGGQHSIFAQAFIGALEENERLLDGYSLFTRVRDFVKEAVKDLAVKQTPEYAPIKFSNHELGEYLFQPLPT